MSETKSNDPALPIRTDKRAPIASRMLHGTKGRKNRFLFIFVLVVIGALVIAFIAQGSSKPVVVTSNPGTVPNIPGTQGSKIVSQSYANDLHEADAARAAAASQTPNESAMPTVILNGTAPVLPPANMSPPADPPPPPLPITASPTPPPEDTTPPPPPASGPVVSNGYSNGVNSVGGNVQQANDPNAGTTAAFMNQINNRIPGAQVIPFDQASVNAGVPLAQASTVSPTQNSDSGANSTTASDTTNAAPAGPYVEPAAGTILYSQLLGRVDSDDPGPVIAEILQGPLSGARLIGAFSAGKDGVVIKFSVMTVPYVDANGQSQTQTISINSVAVDQTHLGDAMATYVNNHILQRVALTFGTAFLQGFGQAIAQSGSTVVSSATGAIATTNPTLSTKQELYEAGGTAAGSTGQIINQIYGSLPTTIIVDAGTPFGLLFLGQSGS